MRQMREDEYFDSDLVKFEVIDEFGTANIEKSIKKSKVGRKRIAKN